MLRSLPPAIVVVMAEGKGTPTSEQEKEPDKRPRWWKRWWGWTQFGKKSGWEWLQLLVVPLALAVIGFSFTMQQDARQQQIENQRAQQAQKIENQRAEAERELAEQRAQDETLQAYLSQIGSLLLEKDLRESKEDSEVRTLARARTLTVLGGLDPSRRTAVLDFLAEAELIQGGDDRTPIISLREADLTDANLFDADLSGAILSDANLSDANLREADLTNAALSRADLRDANLGFVPGRRGGAPALSGAILSDANLSDANLFGADLRKADLQDANLGEADLRSADLRDVDLHDNNLGEVDLSNANLSDADLSTNLFDANLSFANLSDADLSGANLRRADLFDANLSGADLSSANLHHAKGTTRKQLEQAKIHTSIVMPDGSLVFYPPLPGEGQKIQIQPGVPAGTRGP